MTDEIRGKDYSTLIMEFFRLWYWECDL